MKFSILQIALALLLNRSAIFLFFCKDFLIDVRSVFSCRFYFSSKASSAILLFLCFLFIGACLLLKIIILNLSGFWWGHCGAGYVGRGVIQGQHFDHATPSWQPYSLDLWHAGNGLAPGFSYPFVSVLVLTKGNICSDSGRWRWWD